MKVPAIKKKNPNRIRKTSLATFSGVVVLSVRLMVSSSNPGTRKPSKGRQKDPTIEMRKDSCLTRIAIRTGRDEKDSSTVGTRIFVLLVKIIIDELNWTEHYIILSFIGRYILRKKNTIEHLPR